MADVVTDLRCRSLWVVNLSADLPLGIPHLEFLNGREPHNPEIDRAGDTTRARRYKQYP